MQGLRELHKSGTTHGDLKPSNIMVELNNLQVKLSDYGFYREVLQQYVKIPDQSNEIKERTVQISDIFLSGLSQVEKSLQWKMIIDYFRLGCCIAEIVQSNESTEV